MEKISGRKIARVRNKWFKSDEGRQCLKDTAAGQYLKNRLERAFLSGFDAAVEIINEQTQNEARDTEKKG